MNAEPSRWWRVPGPGRAARLILLASFLMKLAFIVWAAGHLPQAIQAQDTPTYVRPALALLESGFYSPRIDAVPAPEIVRPPGYPLVLAGLFLVTDDAIPLAACLSALAMLAVGWLAVAVAEKLANPRAGLLAAVIMVVDPAAVQAGTVAMSDAPFTLLLTAALAAFVARDRATAFSAPTGLACGALLAMATLTRPILYPGLPLVTALFAVGAVSLWGVRVARGWLAAAGFVAPLLLLVGGWQVRNYVRSGDAAMSHVGNANLLFYRAAAVLAELDGESVPAVQRRLGQDEWLWRFGHVAREDSAFGARAYCEVHPETCTLSLPALSKLYRQRGLAVLAAHPWLAVWEHTKGALAFALSPGVLIWGWRAGLIHPSQQTIDAFLSLWPRQTAGLLLHEAPGWLVAALLTMIWNLALIVIAGLGATRLWRRDRVAGVCLTLMPLFFAVVSAGSEALDDRLRLPVIAIIAVLAADWLAGRAKLPPAEARLSARR